MAFPLGYLETLYDYQDEFLAAISETDPTTPVPWCGSWTVEDLVIHLAGVHRWAAGQARREAVAPLGTGPFDLAALYARCADELRGTLAELDADAPAWTLGDDGLPEAERSGTVGFWHRRQMLETLVHAWDLRVAGGRDFDPGPEAWLDCLDEVVTVLHPRQVRLGRIEPPTTRIRFDPDEGSSLLLLGVPDGAVEVTIGGPARSLALLAWGRTGAADPALAVVGDLDALEALLAAGLTP